VKPGDIVSGDGRQYVLLEAVRGAGKSMPWKASDADGHTYFLKRLTSFVFDPTKGDPSTKKYKAKEKAARQFEARHRDIMARLEPEMTGGGNLVKPVHMFRDGGAFVKVYPYIDADSCEVISRESRNAQQLFVKTLLLCVRELHHRGIVHSDLKPDNVLVFKRESGAKVARLVDFDEAYVSGNPPQPPNRMGGDELYYSPEQLAYKRDQLGPESMTTESDIFSLGIVIFKTITGDFPRITGGDGDGPAERLVSGGAIKVHDIPGFPPAFSTALRQTLRVNPGSRPSIDKLAIAMGMPLASTSPPSDGIASADCKPDSAGSRVRSNVGRRGPTAIAAVPDDVSHAKADSDAPAAAIDVPGKPSKLRVNMGRKSRST
jgi:eukaryotic-like serine/threonine-protein kinase